MVVRDNTLSRMSGESLAGKNASGYVSFVTVVVAVAGVDAAASGLCVILETSLQ